MDDKTFDTLVAQAWRRLTDAIDQVDPDIIEATATPDMVTLDVRGNKQIVINTQRAVHQVWVSAQGRGLHFVWDGERQVFRDDKDARIDLFGFLAEVVQGESGVGIRF